MVWVGRKPGIYHSWEECQAVTEGFPAAKFKRFSSLAEAERAFSSGGQSQVESFAPKHSQGYIAESISVDAACSGNPGPMEYRGVYTADGRQLFHHGPVPNGTNNIGEYLAIVHALAWLKQRKSNLPIYSDSAIAIGWVKKKGLNTTVPRNESTREVWDLIDRATKWLQENDYSNPIYKWDTENWGESKADFGRK